MNIRPATALDAPRIALLENAAIAHCPWGETQIAAALADPRYLFFVAETHTIIGYAFGDLTDDGLSVDSVAVESPFRGQGVGAALLTALLSAAAQRGAPAVFLEVDSQNVPALTLYRHLGFAAVYTRKHYYGNGADAIVMTLKLC